MGGDALLHLRIKGNGIEAEVKVVSLTAGTVLLRIDPTTPWDGDALLHLSAALQVVAKTLPSKGAGEAG